MTTQNQDWKLEDKLMQTYEEIMIKIKCKKNCQETCPILNKHLGDCEIEENGVVQWRCSDYLGLEVDDNQAGQDVGKSQLPMGTDNSLNPANIHTQIADEVNKDYGDKR